MSSAWARNQKSDSWKRNTRWFQSCRVLRYSFPQPGPCNAPAVKPQLRVHGRCSWSQGCPEGLKLAMMGGCGTWRVGESLFLQKRAQDTGLGKGVSPLVSQVTVKGLHLSLGVWPSQSSTSTVTWGNLCPPQQGLEQFRGFWPCEVMTFNYMQLNSVKELLGKEGELRVVDMRPEL